VHDASPHAEQGQGHGCARGERWNVEAVRFGTAGDEPTGSAEHDP